MSDLRPALDAVFAPFQIEATITPPGEAPISTVIVWQAPSTARLTATARLTTGLDPMEDLRPRLAVRRDEVPALPVGTEILTTRPPEFPNLTTFVVDRVEDLDPDVFYARVH